MNPIRKKIIIDQQQQPVAVQIPYEDWIQVERALRLVPDSRGATDLADFVGKLNWPVDGLEYQHRVRGEWA